MAFDQKFLDTLKELEAKKPENQRHQEVIGLFKQLLEVTNELKTNAGDKSGLENILKKLDAIAGKSDPQFPDGQNVVKAVDDLTAEVRKELQQVSSEVKKLKLDPKIAVQAPDVKVEAPQVNVPPLKLEPMFKKLDTSIKDCLTTLIKSIPEPKDTDLTPLVERLDQALDALSDIDKGVRMKPQPGTQRVTNPDGSTIGSTDITYATKITVSGTDTYVGEAVPGTAYGTSAWRIQKIDSGGNITWKDGSASFVNSATDLTAGSFS